MKRLLFIALLFVAFDSFSQPLNYTRIANRYRWISGMFDSALYVPRYNGTPSGVRVGENSAIDGAIAVDTLNGYFYWYSGSAWIKGAKYSDIGAAYTSSNGITLSGSNFKLGGTLVDATTTIDVGSNILQIGRTSGSGVLQTLALEVPSGSGNGARLAFSGGGSNIGGIDVIDSSSTFSNMVFNTYRTSGAFGEVMRLKDRNLGIGTSNPDSLLTVSGGGLHTNRGVRHENIPYTLTTTGKKIMLRDTASGLVQNIDPSLIGGTPGGSTKQIQYNNAGSFGGSANMTQETGQILISSTGSTNPFVVKGHEDNGQGSISEWQEHSASAVLFSVNQDTTLSLRDFSGTVTTPAANFGKVYSRDDSLRFKNSTGTEFTLGAGGSSGLTVGTTAITSGTAGRILFEGSGNVLQQESQLFWHQTNNSLQIGVPTTATSHGILLRQSDNTSATGIKVLSNSETVSTDFYYYGLINTDYLLLQGNNSVRLNSAGVTVGANAAPNAMLDIRGRSITNSRFEFAQGADVASVAGAITLGTDGNTFEITGTNAITLISSANWQNGSVIRLEFTSTATLTDGTANSGTDIGMELAGNANFTGSAGAIVTLILSELGGTQRWREVSRSVN